MVPTKRRKQAYDDARLITTQVQTAGHKTNLVDWVIQQEHSTDQEQCHETCRYMLNLLFGHTRRVQAEPQAYPIIGFIPIMLFIMPQPVPEGAAGAKPRSVSEPRSLPLLLRLRESLTCTRQHKAAAVSHCELTSEEKWSITALLQFATAVQCHSLCL